MALTYFFAFYSLHGQVLGLFGREGIYPIGYSDSSLKWMTLTGIIASVLAFSGFFLFFLIAFSLYFFFYRYGYPFLSFQWDALLVETGLIAIFYSLMSPPPILLHIAIWVLLFRLMISSGIVKWRSGCPSWHSFCAMDYHFETQPLPNKGGFFVFHLMKYISKWTSYLVFFFELVVPLLFFGTPFMRLIGAGLTIFFQILIMATGNYAFFNMLTIALCIPLIDDIYLAWIPIAQAPTLDLSIPLNLLGALIILYNVILLLNLRIPGLKTLRSLGLLNAYGLFAVMTTIRNEIIVEGSDDGKLWKEYVFKYKPGLAKEGVQQIAPLQPRLDWQMWFAALTDYRAQPWLQNFIAKLYQNSPEVVKLLKDNPFPGQPPRYIRALLYRFTFCSFAEWRKTGKYWKKEYLGEYL